MVHEMRLSSREGVRRLLDSPRPETRDRTRWWWFGCAVEHDEIRRELDLMAAAGIGGVELQILYPLSADDPDSGVRNRPYLSPGFFEAVEFAAAEAHLRGMDFDLTLGSSWPFGGPFVPESLAAPNVIPYLIPVEGPCRFSYDFTTRIYGECVGCVLGRMEHGKMVPDSIRDISEHVTVKDLFGWEWGRQLETVEIPDGPHMIAIFTVNDKKQTVLKPLPGGDGWIIDHDRKDSLRCFLENGGDPIADRLGNAVDHYFCDSIEVFGQNWTGILYDEFEKRRGYALRPWLYALWGEIDGLTDQIRWDFHKTLSELTVENFFRELTVWAHEKGSRSRIQAHGTWGDILQAYGAADVPEGETFSALDRYEVNLVHRKLASSAGHIYGKPRISNESFTWLRYPRFIVTPEILKAAADAIFLDGMNQIVNHGYAYSPERYGSPGWAFYASTQINHTNTWWPYFGEISRYLNRVCDFLQRGRTAVKLAVYLPQHDIWAENPLSDIHMSMKLEERLTTKTVNAIHKAGFWFDFVNDDAMPKLVELGYEALLFLECDRIPEESARACGNFVASGHPVICRGRTPGQACGLMQNAARTAEIRALFSGLRERGLCTVTADSDGAVLDALRKVLTPDVEILVSPERVGYVHQVSGLEDLYFVANVSAEEGPETLRFSGRQCPFSVWDPFTRQEKPILAAKTDGTGTEITLELEAFQSLFFVFSPAMDGTPKTGRLALQPLMTLPAGWTLTANGESWKTDCSAGWETIPSLRYFSGTGVYRTSFDLTQAAAAAARSCAFLCFSNLGEIAEVTLNGKPAGTILKRPWRLEVGALLRPGRNELVVRVTNLLINRVLDPDFPEPRERRNVIDAWPYSTAKLDLGLQERAGFARERAMISAPLPSGLWGEVSLQTRRSI